ncbi:MAG: alpha/beta fold hydrolase [Proteobacteria bacterium]|nr:alpha/beta fold hydrolase [Pseudomonadota bacterium]MBS0552841.1 alpha/beta fold hydrolase [Pseudomonadota bacterium]
MSRPLVLLHGWGLTPAVWQPLLDALPKTLDVHTPALPGHAQATAAAPGIAAWTEALLAQIPHDAVVCGWSLGAMVALDLAARHPSHVARLILIGSTPRFVSTTSRDHGDAWPHGLDPAVADDFAARFDHDPAATMQRFVALQALGDARRRAVTTALTAALSDTGAEGARALADGLQVLTTTDLRPAIARITRPTLLLHGDGDALMPLAAAQWLAAHLPRARLLPLAGCGHAPFLSQAADCAAAIGRFTLE